MRNALPEAIEIIEDMNDENLKGVFHCFTGDIQGQAHAYEESEAARLGHPLRAS